MKKKGRKEKKARGSKHSKKDKAEEEVPAAAPAAAPSAAVSQDPLAQVETLSLSIGGNKAYLKHGLMLRDPTYADVQFLLHVGSKKETVHAHSFILSHRAPGLLAEGKLVSKVAKTKDHAVVHISDAALEFCNVQILSVVLRFLYTGDTHVKTDDLPVLMNLLTTVEAAGLASSSLSSEVERKCRTACGPDNLHTVLRVCTDRNLSGLGLYARSQALSAWDSFVGNRSGCRILGLDLLSDLSAEASKGSQVEVPELAQPHDGRDVLMAYQNLFEKMSAADCELLYGVEGLPCHRAVLAAFSPTLAARLRMMGGKMKSPRGGKKRLPGVTIQSGHNMLQDREAAESLLKFIYYGDQNMSAGSALALIRSCASFDMPPAIQLFEHVISNGIDNQSAVPILGVCFAQGWAEKQSVQELRDRVTRYIVSNFSSIDANSFPPIQPEIMHLLKAMQLAGYGSTGSAPEVLDEPAPELPLPPRPEDVPPELLPPPPLPANPPTLDY